MHFRILRSVNYLTTAILLFCSASLMAESNTYKIDPTHSGITFKVRHFLTKVPGTFGAFSGHIKFDPANPENCYAEATINVSSVDTNNDKRDAHLLNEDFFTSEKYPEITFKSITWEQTDEKKYAMTGLLTLLDISRKVTVDVTFIGTTEGFGGKQLAAWEGTVVINRTDFGLTYGPGVVGEDVEIELNIEAYKE